MYVLTAGVEIEMTQIESHSLGHGSDMADSNSIDSTQSSAAAHDPGACVQNFCIL